VSNAVEINSPGFWEFLGSVSPLEIMRNYLNDRHERRKDREYLESAEERRLALENLARENDVLTERIRIARDIGATDSGLAPLLSQLIYKPLAALDAYQDKKIIEGAELFRLPDERAE